MFTISVDDVHIIDTRTAYCQQLTLTVAMHPLLSTLTLSVATATVSVNMLTLCVATAPLIVNVYTKRRVDNKRRYNAL